MSLAKTEELIRSLEDRIGTFWKDYGFEYVGHHKWLRRWGWKTDEVRLIPKADLYLILNFTVFIPPRPGSGFDCWEVGMIDLHQLANRSGTSIRFPSFPWTCGRFIEDIISDMPQAVEWFSQYDTPESCLEHLLTPNVNPNSEAFRYSQSYLQSLVGEVTKSCSPVNVEHEFPNPYSKAIFDINHRGHLPEPKDEYYDLG